MDGLKVVELVCLFQMYFSESGNDNLKNFSAWLSKNSDNSTSDILIDEEKQNIEIIDSFIRISKFIKLYNKEVFQNHTIKRLHEHKFLLTVDKLENPAKSDIYTETITELTTGAKIMKRIITMGLIKETDDKMDKRIKRLKLTPKGKNELDAVSKNINANNNLIMAFTTDRDKSALLSIIKTIDNFHTEEYLKSPEHFADEKEG